MLPVRLAFFSSLLLLAAPSLAVNLLQSAPACGQTCGALLSAQGACTPPAVPDSTLQSYKDCFCGTANALTTSSTTYCADTCTGGTADTDALLSWFTQYCNLDAATTSGSPVASAPTQSTGPASGPPRTRTRNPVSTPSVPAIATQSGGVAVPGGSSIPVVYDGPANRNQPSWWSSHYQWIVMAIVLIIGFSIIIGVGIFFKRRHDRKRNAASNLPSNAVWGPNTSQFRSSSVYATDESAAMREKPRRTRRFSAK